MRLERKLLSSDYKDKKSVVGQLCCLIKRKIQLCSRRFDWKLYGSVGSGLKVNVSDK
jgi:hypothetical protein